MLERNNHRSHTNKSQKRNDPGCRSLKESMVEDKDVPHELLMDIKRIDGVLERIDITCKKYDEEKMDAALAILKIKSELENIRKILPHMSGFLEEKS